MDFCRAVQRAVILKNHVMEAQVYQRKKRILALLFALLLLMEIFV
jgi:uncharacterized membrane protein